MAENRALVSLLAEKLDIARIDYMIIGGQAVLVYGEPRLTKDIDITIGLDPAEKGRIIEFVKSNDLSILVQNIEQFIDETFVLPCDSKKHKLRVDFILSNSEYEMRAFKRVNEIEIDGYKVKFASVEDLIIHKIIAGRPRDIEDIKVIVLKNKNIDVDYIRSSLKSFEIMLALDFQSVLKELFPLN